MGQVYIGKVIAVNSIEGADRIESLKVDCGVGGTWQGTAQKGQLAEGSLCQVYLQDSLLPKTDEFSFMEKYNYRVRMMRFKGVPSEVLIMPQSIHGNTGDDVTAQAGVNKYEKPIPASISGQVLRYFPGFLRKTDEPNFQTVPEMVATMQGQKFYSSVKCDGSSATVYKYNGEFGCCSRNMELKETADNAIWKIARKYDLENVLPDGLYFQFEVVGPGIQKNPMGLTQIEPRLFNVFSIPEKNYLNGERVKKWSEQTGVPMVPITDWDQNFSFSEDDLRKYAEGLYDNGKQREGVVIRPMVEMTMPNWARVSFKVINLIYRE
jgi:RNA ligase (TIGR02306 family)